MQFRIDEGLPEHQIDGVVLPGDNLVVFEKELHDAIVIHLVVATYRGTRCYILSTSVDSSGEIIYSSEYRILN